jgi:TRAP-type C4-dicarboxylate transport system permease small subunit
MKIFTKIGVLFDHIITVSAWLACGCILFSMLSINVDVVMRQVFNHPVIWVLEVNEYLLLYMTFLGTAFVLRDEGHTTMDLVIVQLDAKQRNRLRVFTSMIGAGCCIILGVYSGISTWKTYKAGWYYETILMAPHWIMHIIVSFGFFLLFLQFIRFTRQYLAANRALQKN